MWGQDEGGCVHLGTGMEVDGKWSATSLKVLLDICTQVEPLPFYASSPLYASSLCIVSLYTGLVETVHTHT